MQRLGCTTRVAYRDGMAQQVDIRGTRIGAAITAVVLAAALILAPSPAAVVLTAWQTLAFGLGAFAGLRSQPYGAVYRAVIAPRLRPATAFEAPEPPRFAQLVGFGFAAVGLVALLASATAVAQVALALALGAAFLNAAFGICLGCEVYTLGKRALAR